GAVRYVAQARGGDRGGGGEGGGRSEGEGAPVVSDRVHPTAPRQLRIDPQRDRVIPTRTLGPEEPEWPKGHVPVLLRHRRALINLQLAGDDGLVTRIVRRDVPAVKVVELLLLDVREEERRQPVGEGITGGAVGPLIHESRWKRAIGVVIVVQAQPEL